MPTRPRQYLSHNMLRDGVRVEQRVHEIIFSIEIPGEVGLREALRDQGCSHTRGLVPSDQFGGETFVEGSCGRL